MNLYIDVEKPKNESLEGVLYKNAMRQYRKLYYL